MGGVYAAFDGRCVGRRPVGQFVVLFVKKWFLFALWRLSFPELVRENRLAHPL